jgi:hemolysin III
MARDLRIRVFKEPASAWTHFVGLLLALVAAAVLVARAAGDRTKLVGMAVYGATLVAVFFASSVYHFFDLGRRGNRWLQRMDHAAIFLLIAGTCVPPLVHLLDGRFRIAFLLLVAGLAAAGALLKVVWIDCPPRLGLALYLGLAGAALLPARQIVPQLSPAALAWLVSGGAAYLLGAFVYARGWPDPWPGRFGHHEVWHLFVLAGAGAHYAFASTFVGLPYPPF